MNNTDVEKWLIFLHLSQLLGWVFPFGNLLAPLILWQMKKDENLKIDEHGKAIVNWQLSLCIYGIVAIVLSFILVGIPMLLAIFFVSVLCPILGPIKAYNDNGNLYAYPMTLHFLK